MKIDLEEISNLGLNYNPEDIKNISSKEGSFSKTITISSTENYIKNGAVHFRNGEMWLSFRTKDIEPALAKFSKIPTIGNTNFIESLINTLKIRKNKNLIRRLSRKKNSEL